MKNFYFAAGTLFGIVGLATTALVLLLQTYEWLREGVWPSTTFGTGLRGIGIDRPFTPGWRGVQQIVDYIFDAPLSLSLFGYSIAIAAFFIWKAERIGKIPHLSQ